VQQQGFGNAWNADVLAQMEGWLAAWTRSFPAKPVSGNGADMRAMRALLAELAEVGEAGELARVATGGV
jgi:hypothetical protein